jgi:hypothetical protein
MATFVKRPTSSMTGPLSLPHGVRRDGRYRVVGHSAGGATISLVPSRLVYVRAVDATVRRSYCSPNRTPKCFRLLYLQSSMR